MDVGSQRNRFGDRVHDLVKKNVAEQRSHEEDRGAAGIVDAKDSRLRRTLEVAGHQHERPARRRIGSAGIERNHERCVPRALVHLKSEIPR